MRRRYGKDIYFTAGISIPIYGYMIFLMLKKFRNDTLMLDPTLAGILITQFSFNIISAYRSIRLQWQTNCAHQRINKNQEPLSVAVVKDAPPK